MENIYGKWILKWNMNINTGKLNVCVVFVFFTNEDMTNIALQLKHLYVQQNWTPLWNGITNISILTAHKPWM